MASFEGLLADANLKLKQADHMVSVTYPLLKEPKLLLSSLRNIYDGVIAAMRAILAFERSRKEIPLYTDSFASQFEVFSIRVAPKHNINKNYIRFIAHLKEFADHHTKATVEFRRKDTYVMADDDYEMKSLSAPLIKEQLAFARAFVIHIRGIILDEQELEIDTPRHAHPSLLHVSKEKQAIPPTHESRT